MKKIDAKGQNCPIPVIMAKKEMDAGQISFLIEVDQSAACENLKRLGESQNYHTVIIEKENFWEILFSKNDCPIPLPESSSATLPPSNKNWVLLIGSQTIGSGDPELGRTLMKMFFYTLSQSDDLPKSVIFINTGVKAAVQNSQIIEHLQTLSQKGVKILICGTCLNFYHLSDPPSVCNISNMYEILLQMQQADKVVSL